MFFAHFVDDEALKAEKSISKGGYCCAVLSVLHRNVTSVVKNSSRFDSYLILLISTRAFNFYERADPRKSLRIVRRSESEFIRADN